MDFFLSRFTSKPHYIFHPTRALRRALYGVSGASRDTALHEARLPWDLTIDVYRSDAIGFSILTGGVFDPCVSETIFRLIEPGDLVVDVGANIGYVTSLAAARSGSTGAVLAYEPHPRVFEMLSANVARWRGRSDLARIEIHQVALSDHTGTGELASGPLLHRNTGLATLSAPPDAGGSGELVSVPVRRLDDVLAEGQVGVLKIDVEGHEPEVLGGARALLESGRVRDVVFEDHEDYPSQATAIVEAAGYRLLSLDNDLLGLRLGAPADRGAVSPWPGPSYLATLDAARAFSRLRPRGWQIKGIGPSLHRRWR